MTKRILSILVAVLMVMALIPMGALAASEDNLRSGGDAPQTKANESVADISAFITYDFEYHSEDEFDWTLIDSDGDGYNWMWLCYGINYGYESSYQGNGHLSSASYTANTPLSPDNWAITPAIEIPDGVTDLTFYVNGQDPSYSHEHYAVYAALEPTVDAMMEGQILDETVATSDYVLNTIDMTGFAGQTIYIGFRHFNVYDMFRINLDYVQIHAESALPFNDPVPVYGCYFETDEDFEGWESIDADGDGYGWEVETYFHSEGHQSVRSCSFISGESLDPDNWLIAPPLLIPDIDPELTFYSMNYVSNYPDKIVVYIGEDSGSIEDFVPISEIITPPSAFSKYTIDLSDYAGSEAVIAIRHFDSYDMYKVYVDEFEVWGAYSIDSIELDGFTAPEWGEAPDNELSVPENARYSLYDAKWGYMDSEGAFVPMEEGEVFDNEELDYCQRFVVVTDTYYGFPDNVNALIDGDSTNVGSLTSYGTQGVAEIYTVPFNVADPIEHIETIELTGLVQPAWGEAPSYEVSVPEDAPYTITLMEWRWYEGDEVGIMEEGDVFDSETRGYFMFFEIEPNEGAAFTNDMTATIDGSDSLINNFGFDQDSNYCYLSTVEFNVVDTTIYVDTIDVLGFVVPEWGEAPFYELSVPDDADYTIDSVEWYAYTPDKDLMEAGDLFDSEELAYCMNVTVILNEGCDFEEPIACLLDGSDEYVADFGCGINDQGQQFAYITTCSFTVKDPTIYIDTIELTGFIAPEWGAAPSYEVTVPEDAGYMIDSSSWHWYNDDETGLMEDGDLFDDPDRTYFQSFNIVPLEGYAFAEEVTIKINDSEELVAYENCAGDRDEYEVITIEFTVEEPILWGDADGNGEVDTADVILVMRYSLGLDEIAEENLFASDVNGDGAWDFTDALLILRKIMGVIDSFPVEEQ